MQKKKSNLFKDLLVFGARVYIAGKIRDAKEEKARIEHEEKVDLNNKLDAIAERLGINDEEIDFYNET